MKVKARYSISCDKGYFETGEIFDIESKDLPMYGDAVTVLEKAPESKAEPAKEPEKKEPEAADAKPAEEKQTAPKRNTRKRA